MRPTPIATLSSTFFVFGLALATVAFAQIDGTLDTSFYFDGKLTLEPTVGHQQIRALAVAPDGRLVIAGERSTDESGESRLFWAALDGVSAPTICTAEAPGGGLFASAEAAAFDAEGRLVLAGSASFPGSGYEGIALRYLYPACDLDESFNLDGVFRSDYPGAARYHGLAFTSAGRLVLAGDLADGSAALVARLTENGLYDFGFDGDGRLELALDSSVAIAAVAVQTDDRILLAGSIGDSFRDLLVVRIDPLGDLDDTFSGDGQQQISFGEDYNLAYALALDPASGAILVAGEAGDFVVGSSVVARLTPSGALDPAFSGDGKWSHAAFDTEGSRAIAVQSDGRILVVGQGGNFSGDSDFLVYRLESDGDFDGGFGWFGGATVAIDEGGMLDDDCRAAALQGGLLAIAGRADSADEPVGAVARLWIRLIFTDDFERGSAGGWSLRVP